MSRIGYGIEVSVHCLLLTIACFVFTYSSFEVARDFQQDAHLVYLAAFAFYLISLRRAYTAYAKTTYEQCVLIIGACTIMAMGLALLVPGTALTTPTILWNEPPSRFTGVAAAIALSTWVLAIYVGTPRLSGLSRALFPFKRT